MNFIQRFFKIVPRTFSLRVSITEEDIKNGTPGAYSMCPGALAISRAVDELFPFDEWDVSVGEEATSLYKFYLKGQWSNKRLWRGKSPILKQFIWQFDKGHEVKPVDFEMIFTRMS